VQAKLVWLTAWLPANGNQAMAPRLELGLLNGHSRMYPLLKSLMAWNEKSGYGISVDKLTSGWCISFIWIVPR
jgi:hypothetical protein